MGIYVVATVSLICFVRRCGELNPILRRCGVSNFKPTIFGKTKQIADTLRCCGLSYGRSY